MAIALPPPALLPPPPSPTPPRAVTVAKRPRAEALRSAFALRGFGLLFDVAPLEGSTGGAAFAFSLSERDAMRR